MKWKETSGFVERTGDARVITGGSPWQDTLQPGQYEIAVRSVREDNLLPYTLQIETSELIPGLRQSVDLPADLTVRLGKPGIVDLFSFGATDVRGSLWNETGTRPFSAERRYAERLEFPDLAATGSGSLSPEVGTCWGKLREC